ncbi:MAG: hypothetical protein HY438_02945 [DPANN group archaeon]|nr:hypothetical protein [DPANN group archaeon]
MAESPPQSLFDRLGIVPPHPDHGVFDRSGPPVSRDENPFLEMPPPQSLEGVLPPSPDAVVFHRERPADGTQPRGYAPPLELYDAGDKTKA